MQKLTLISKDGRYTFETELKENWTILNVKQYLKKQINIVYPNLEEDQITVTHMGEVISDASPIKDVVDGISELVFDVGVKTIENKKNCDDVVMGDIQTMVKVKISENNKVIEVKPEELITYNGKMYLITEKRKIIDLKAVIENLRNIKITRDDAVKITVLLFLFFTKNTKILSLLIGIFGLELISKRITTMYPSCTKNIEHCYRSFYMFFISMFMIDHNRF